MRVHSTEKAPTPGSRITVGPWPPAGPVQFRWRRQPPMSTRRPGGGSGGGVPSWATAVAAQRNATSKNTERKRVISLKGLFGRVAPCRAVADARVLVYQFIVEALSAPGHCATRFFDVGTGRSACATRLPARSAVTASLTATVGGGHARDVSDIPRLSSGGPSRSGCRPSSARQQRKHSLVQRPSRSLCWRLPRLWRCSSASWESMA